MAPTCAATKAMITQKFSRCRPLSQSLVSLLTSAYSGPSKAMSSLDTSPLTA